MSEQENNGLIPPFWGYSAFTPTIPKMYWNVKSQEQRILNLFDLLDKLVCYCDDVGILVNVNSNDIAKLKADFEKFKETGFLDYYQKQLEEWFLANAWQLYQMQAKQVYFGLTDDGYFCAYVPDSWKEITFDTGAVFGRTDYGRLCLKFDSVGQGVIDNAYSYSLNDWQVVSNDFKKALLKLTSDLEINSKRTDSVFDTLYTNIDQDISRGGENV